MKSPVSFVPMLLASALGFGLPCSPRNAWAGFGDPELRAGISGGYDCYADVRRYHGIGGALDLHYVLGPTWAVMTRYGYGIHQIRDASFHVQQLGLGARYQLDVFEYVPWLELAPGAYLSGGEGGPHADFSGGLRAGLGFDRLLDEHVGLSLGAHYHRLLGETRFPAYLEVHVGIAFRWGLGDTLGP